VVGVLVEYFVNLRAKRATCFETGQFQKFFPLTKKKQYGTEWKFTYMNLNYKPIKPVFLYIYTNEW